MSVTSTLPLLEGFESWVTGLGDAGVQRRAAAGQLGEQYPTRRDEQWRFTALGPFEQGRRCVDDPATTFSEAAFVIEGLQAANIDLANGRLVSAPTLEGVRIREFTAAEVLERDGGEFSAPEALNQAWGDRGVLIEVEDNSVVERPLHLRVWSDAGAAFYPQTRVILRLGRSSRLRLLEHHRSGTPESALNLHMDVNVGDNAQLEHVQLTGVDASAAHSTSLRTVVGRDARHDHWNFVVDGGWVRNDLHARLAGTGSAIGLMGLVVADGDQMIDAHTRVEHAADHATSVEHYRHVLDDNARVVFAGRVYVDKNVHGSDAEQNNANLLLSESARMNALPQLEIYNDDVKASHGSTMGQLDEDALFYLRSRGIDNETAKGLLLWGFANSIVEQLDWPAVTSLVQREVRGHLADVPVAEG